MSKDKFPVTNAVRVLREHGVEFESHAYDYVEKGGTSTSSRELGVDEHAVVKTLVMEDEDKTPLIVLMHGDKQVSTKSLARALGKRSIQPCKPEVAERHSGYQVGGTSPFGTRRAMTVCLQRTVLELPRVWINAGRRGYLVSLDPRAIVRVLEPTLVDVAIDA